MKRILRIVNTKSGQFAEAEMGAWIAALVAMMPPEQRDSLFNAIRNNLDYVVGGKAEDEVPALVCRGKVYDFGFILSEFE